MKRFLVFGALALAACTTAQIQSELQRAESRYQIAKAVAEVVLPWAPPERQAQIRLAEQAAESALAAARAATDIAARDAELRKAAEATAVINPPAPVAAVPPPPLAIGDH